MGFADLKEIAKGAFGYVYKATYQNHVVALKMVLAARHGGLLEKSRLIRRFFREAAAADNHPTQGHEADAICTDESQYYVEDHVFRLTKTDEITCHLMEFIPGKDLLEYMQAFEHQLHRRRVSTENARHGAYKHAKSMTADQPTVPSPTFETFFLKLCSMARAVRFLSHAHVVFNDLKLENVVCLGSGVVLVDYIDSDYKCSKLMCEDSNKEHIISTYNDTVNNRRSLSEDVWRLALVILDSMMQLQTTPFVDSYPSEQITDAMVKDRYIYPTDLISGLVNACVNRTTQTFNYDAKIPVERLKSTLNAMLHEDPAERPSADELLEPNGPYAFAGKGTSPKLTPERQTAKKALVAVRKAMQERLR